MSGNMLVSRITQTRVVLSSKPRVLHGGLEASTAGARPVSRGEAAVYVCPAQLVQPDRRVRFPSSTPRRQLPRVLALLPHFNFKAASHEQFRLLSLRLAQVRCMARAMCILMSFFLTWTLALGRAQ